MMCLYIAEHGKSISPIFPKCSKHFSNTNSMSSWPSVLLLSKKLHYLGYVVSSEGVATDPNNIQIIVDWPPPANVEDLRSFLGMAGYYRKFVKHFGWLSRPLTNLLKKGEQYIWKASHQESFEALKNAPITSLVLALPNFSEPFTMETDASDKYRGCAATRWASYSLCE